MSAQIAAQSIPDTASSAGISRSMLYEMIKEGRGPRVVKLGRRSVVLIADRDSWLQSLAKEVAA
jgi:predicted DNA-binding transcriptional regulator AlpA